MRLAGLFFLALPFGSVDRIVVDKSEHTLEAFRMDRLVRTFTVAIGLGGEGAKRFEGDLKTPEGTYRIDRRHRSEAFHRFLHVSYPNAADRAAHARGVRDGTIPRGVGIGGAIGIHGAPRGIFHDVHKAVDWTAGCIALDDDEIEALYRAVRTNAVVVIRP